MCRENGKQAGGVAALELFVRPAPLKNPTHYSADTLGNANHCCPTMHMMNPSSPMYSPLYLCFFNRGPIRQSNKALLRKWQGVMPPTRRQKCIVG